jgi:hypothetical protein
MKDPSSLARRRLLRTIVLGVPLAALGVEPRARAASNGAPLLDAASPEAQAVKYVEDAAKASGARGGSTCANCALYQGALGSAQGACQLFPGKDVRAAGWCSSWAPQM